MESDRKQKNKNRESLMERKSDQNKKKSVSVQPNVNKDTHLYKI